MSGITHQKKVSATSSFLPPIQKNSVIEGERLTFVESDSSRMSTIMITNTITREEKKVELDFQRNKSKVKAVKVLKLSAATAYSHPIYKPPSNTENEKKEGQIV